MNNNHLSADQKKTLKFIKVYLRKFGFAPTLKEIGEGCGWSITHAWRQVQALADKGMIRRGPAGSCRAMALVPAVRPR